MGGLRTETQKSIGVHLVGLLLEPLPEPSYDYARISHFVISDTDNIEKFGISINEEGLVTQIKSDQRSFSSNRYNAFLLVRRF
jgi:hypothetical protein